MLSREEQKYLYDLLDKGMPFAQIARQLGRSVGTVYRYKRSRMEDGGLVREGKTLSPKILPFQEAVRLHIKRGEKNVKKIFYDLRNAGYKGSYFLLNNYIRHQPDSIEQRHYKRSVRVETGPGEQAQVDWGSFGSIRINGRKEKLYAFVCVLSYSRAIYVEFVVRQNQPTLQNCHIHAFQKLGIPKAIRYDNVKTVVLSREKLPDGNKKINLNPAFEDFAAYHGFDIELCPPYWPRAKGKVEAGIKYVRHNFAQGKKFKKTFRTLEELNAKVLVWVDKIAQERVHATTQEKPIDRWRKEKPFLRFLDDGRLAYSTTPLLPRRSTKDGMVQYRSTLYSVPSAFAQKKLEVREVNKHGLPFVEIYYKNDLVAQHQLSTERGKWIINDHHLLNSGQGRQLRVVKDTKKLISGDNRLFMPVVVRNLNYYNIIAR